MSACEKVIYAIPLDGARGILKKFPVGRRWRFQAEAGDADRSASHRLTWPSSAPRSEGVGIGLKRPSFRWRDDAVSAGLGGGRFLLRGVRGNAVRLPVVRSIAGRGRPDRSIRVSAIPSCGRQPIGDSMAPSRKPQVVKGGKKSLKKFEKSPCARAPSPVY